MTIEGVIEIVNKNKFKKRSKFTKKVFNFIIFIITCLLLGFFIGYLSAKYFDGIIVSSDNLITYFFNVCLILSALVLLYLFHIIIHEAGHLVFGLATGYSFVSFRVGSFTIIKEDGKFKFKKYNIPGTAGQCLMMPPELKDGKYPFVIYNFGGVIMNLIVSVISILSVIFIKEMTFPLNIILVLFGLAGIFAALTNGIPFKISGIANDAYNVISILKDEEARRGFYLQLRVNGLLSNGIRIKDMDYSIFKLKEGSNIANPLNTGIRLMEYNWHLDNMDLDSARKCIDSFVPYFSELVPLYTYEINCERMFLELVGECNKGFIDRLYNQQLKKYIKAAKFMIGKKRLLMAYEAFYNEDKAKALEYYKELKKLYESYPVKGEADMELMLADWIKDKIEQQ